MSVKGVAIDAAGNRYSQEKLSQIFGDRKVGRLAAGRIQQEAIQEVYDKQWFSHARPERNDPRVQALVLTRLLHQVGHL